MKGGLKLTRKSILSMMMALAIMLSLFSITTFAATTTGENGTKNYELPLTSTVPTLDGDLSDATWSGETLTIQLNLKDCVANGGYAKNPTTSGASGELKAVWSNAEGKEGLYFAWHVKDETQSWAADINGIAFNAMDAVQVVIDPLYKRRTSKSDCAMCFTFTAYASMSGNGMCPTESGRWYEYWMWESAYEGSGVQMGSATNKREDTIKENGIDRKYLLDEYWIEAYLPASALNVNGQEPEFKVGTKMGIGFTLIDYDWISEGFVINETDIAETQQLINLFADFGGGKDRFNYPKYYNTITLVEKLGQAPTEEPGTETPGVEDGNDVSSITFADSAEAYSALQSELEIATKISSDTAYEKYYAADSIASLETAAQAAQKLTETNTLEELTAAVISMKEARIQMTTTMTLKELLDVVGELKEADFNSGDWTVIQDKVNEAKGFLNEDGSEITDDAEALANIKFDIIKLLVENDELIAGTTNDDDDKSGADGLVNEAPAEEESGLQTWQIVLIVVGAIVVVAVVVIIIVAVNKKKKAGEVESEEEDSEEETEEEVEGEETAEEETEEVAEEETSEDNADNE